MIQEAAGLVLLSFHNTTSVAGVQTGVRTCRRTFDVAFTFEERVMDQLIEGLPRNLEVYWTLLRNKLCNACTFSNCV